MSFTHNNHTNPLTELIKNFTNPDAKAYTSLSIELHSIRDSVLVLGEDNLPKETTQYCWKPLYVQVDFLIWVPSAPLIISELMGKITKTTGEKYESCFGKEVITQIRHQTGLRLEKIMQCQRETYFHSELLGYENKKVSEEIVQELLNSENRKISFIHDS